ncbi:MAG: YbaK/EbsC family protein [Actinomycetaceae bacterium]|nr:YbaK/EbsC family protein [Actinomycetaceae bacterium]
MEQTASTPAVAFLIERGVPFDQLEYEHTDDFTGGFGAEASQKLGIAPAEVFKTLMVEADTEPSCVLVPVDHRMSLKKVAKALHAKKAEMMPANKAQNRTGYIVGGISPFGQKNPAPSSSTKAASTLTT